MSDTIPDNGQTVDRRRALASLAAACAVHAALLIAFALGLGTIRGAAVMPPVTIDLQAPTGPGIEASAGSPGPGGGPAAGAAEKVSASPAPAVGAQSSAAGTQSPAVGAQSSTNGGFVIPTPRAQPVESPASASGSSSFREAGGRTGVVQGIPSVPGPAAAPIVPPVQQGKGTGSASSSGAGTSAAQRSGTGVLVPGSSGSTSGSLDLSQLDKALAGGGAGKGAARSSGTAQASGAAGSRGSGTGGAGGSGSTGSGGTGSGGSGAGGSAGATGTTGAGSGQNYSVVWGSPDAGRGRALVFRVDPKLPRWVSEQGLTLSVTVSFTVLPDGVISGATVQQSSGYADVDARVMEAIRMCLFNAVPGAAAAKGSIPYVISPR